MLKTPVFFQLISGSVDVTNTYFSNAGTPISSNIENTNLKILHSALITDTVGLPQNTKLVNRGGGSVA